MFNAMLENATRLCGAKFGILWLREGDGFRSVALHNVPPAYAEQRQREPVIHPGPGTGLGRVAKTKQVIHVADVRAEEAYIQRDPLRVSTVELGGYRTVLDVPMLKDNELIGIITIYRQEVRPFTDKQIELVTTFANQAVIAIENARLFEAEQARTRELAEALEQQTATSEVLQIISSSPGDLEPVFQGMLTNATRICEAVFGSLYLYDANAFRMVAAHYDSPAYVAARTRDPLLRPPPDAPLGRVAITKQVVQVADIRTLPSKDHPFVAAGVNAGYRTVLAIPLLKDNELIGAFTLIRQEVRTFSDKQIALLTNFARQAVIAIENARLLNELRESLEQQTATSEVLQVISTSPGELEPVFQAML
ncbi:MAG TPA: GAF domain-containing protein, partial [Candidatus Tectomicrobia bacterium]|nr:GAF domain-containing protein [Candidatus Tectomicrobia bacterium]